MCEYEVNTLTSEKSNYRNSRSLCCMVVKRLCDLSNNVCEYKVNCLTNEVIRGKTKLLTQIVNAAGHLNPLTENEFGVALMQTKYQTLIHQSTE